jgi:TorA maturation chaperone TorD
LTERAELLVGERAPIYRLVARLLIREVDAATWVALREPAIVDFLEAAAPDFGDWIAREPNAERLEELAEEFARLFLVPGGVPLFASAWIEGQSESVANGLAHFVSEILEATGRETVFAEPWGRLPLDHLALWLDLVAGLADESPELARHLDDQLMGPWIISLGRSLEEHAASPLYRSVGALLQDLNG